eukprot:1994762-Pyramimonas_sp.AAC.2
MSRPNIPYNAWSQSSPRHDIKVRAQRAKAPTKCRHVQVQTSKPYRGGGRLCRAIAFPRPESTAPGKSQTVHTVNCAYFGTKRNK